ncbi:MAG: hypothetical protein LBI63_01350 [Candidatus Ancillula sp.]|jgi:hypothetical protein|nr:hypothetical protein [Candidatus Ancillula sp.]
MIVDELSPHLLMLYMQENERFSQVESSPRKDLSCSKFELLNSGACKMCPIKSSCSKTIYQD